LISDGGGEPRPYKALMLQKCFFLADGKKACYYRINFQGE